MVHSSSQLCVLQFTLPETNIESEKRPLEKEIQFLLETIMLNGYVTFREGIFLNISC